MVKRLVVFRFSCLSVCRVSWINFERQKFRYLWFQSSFDFCFSHLLVSVLVILSITCLVSPPNKMNKIILSLVLILGALLAVSKAAPQLDLSDFSPEKLNERLKETFNMDGLWVSKVFFQILNPRSSQIRIRDLISQLSSEISNF